jgi:hypothetical protein
MLNALTTTLGKQEVVQTSQSKKAMSRLLGGLSLFTMLMTIPQVLFD